MPLSDATASTAPSQGQLEEELLIYGQCYSNPSTTCLAPPNHWQHRGVISHSLSPGSLPLHRLPLGDSVSFPVCFCLSVFVCLYVGFAHSFSALPVSSHTDRQILISSVSHKQTHLCACTNPCFLQLCFLQH